LLHCSLIGGLYLGHHTLKKLLLVSEDNLKYFPIVYKIVLNFRLGVYINIKNYLKRF
jgi:hypothetical protein